MSVAWIRVSRSCQNACLFCDQQAELDGRPVTLEEIVAELDAAKAAGADTVVLSGGEPTLNRALLGAIRHAKGLGLRVSMTTNGRVLQTEKHIAALKAAGLDEIGVSVHSGRKSNHDVLVGREGAWVESLQALRVAGRGGIRTVLKTVLTLGNDDDLEHLQHLGTMAGIAEMELRAPRAVGGMLAPGRRQQLEVTTAVGLRIVEELWYAAKEEVTRFSAVGFEDTVDLGLVSSGHRRQADLSALHLLRRRVHLACAGLGFTLLDADGMGKDLVGLCEGSQGLAQVGHELAARGAPIVDAPPCVGGLSEGGPDLFADAVHEDPACAACPARPACARLPRKLGKVAGHQLAPLPGWRGLGGPIAVLGGSPALAAAVAGALGREACGGDLSGAASAVFLTPGAAAEARRAGFAGRAVVIDDGASLEGALGPDDVLESPCPGRVERLVHAVPLRQVRWAPGPVLAPGQPPEAGGLAVLDPDLSEAEGAAVVVGARVVLLSGRAPLSPKEARWISSALAGGRPVVAWRRAGVEDLVRHDLTGLLVGSGPGVGAAEVARRLLTDEATLGRLSAGALALGRAATPEGLAERVLHGRPPSARGHGTPERPWATW